MKKIKYLSLFSGYCGGSHALKRLKINAKCIGFSDIDKNSIKCLQNNFPDVHQLGSVVDIDTTKLVDFDLLMAGFPCQDVSIAGNRDLSKGRTTLFNEIIRIAKDKKPTYLLLENVEGILSAKYPSYNSYHDYVLQSLYKLGYGVCWKKVNSREHGIPQNRVRIFYVCKLGGWDFMEFQFPEKEKLKITIKDILEENVDKKYYLTEKAKARLLRGDFKNLMNKDSPYSGCVLATNYKRNYQSPIIHNLAPRSGDPSKGGTGHLTKSDGTTYCLNTAHVNAIEENDTYRYLTPTECFRLMGFLDDDIKLDGLSDTAKYKLAGNGWEIQTVMKILNNIFKSSS